MLKKGKPFIRNASHVCTAFRRLQEVLKHPKQNTREVEQLVSEAMDHLRVVLEMCIRQHELGRLFLFELPASAASWHTQMLRAVAALNGVHRINFDFSSVGMTSRAKEGGVSQAKKHTILANSAAISTILREVQCRRNRVHQP